MAAAKMGSLLGLVFSTMRMTLRLERAPVVLGLELSLVERRLGGSLDGGGSRSHTRLA